MNSFVISGMRLIPIVILLSVVIPLTMEYNNVIVNTKYGKLKGVTSISRDGREYYKFLGIPYAAPPVGHLRFQSPIKPKTWSGTRDAILYGSSCIQVLPIYNIRFGSEDCLFLNVFTKNIPRLGNPVDSTKYMKLLPVLIYIHSGFFMTGGSVEGHPGYIMDENIVFVTINYRLASFGFLNTGDGIIRGNMGLKDQVLAFKWVQENIQNFGGDPNLVTIIGFSAGGASVHYHMMSSMSKGLFHRAISMSGTSLNPWAFTKKPKQQAQRFGNFLNCPTNSSVLLLDCLKLLSARDINKAHAENVFLPENRLATFSPTIETVADADVFLTKSPHDLVKTKLINNVPWMTGVNNAEALIYVLGISTNKTLQSELSKHWLKRAPTIFDYEHLSVKEKAVVTHEIQKHYFDQTKVDFEKIDNVVKLFSDFQFFQSFHTAAVANSNSSDTYLYYNTYELRRSTAQIVFNLSLRVPFWLDYFTAFISRWVRVEIFQNIPQYYGANHHEYSDLIFKVLRTIIRPGSPDYNVSKHLTRTIAYFAKHGKPPISNEHKWPMAKPGQPLQFLEISKKSVIIDDPLLKRVEFWKKLKNKYNF